MRICTVILAICLVLSPVRAFAQQNGATAAPPRLIISERAIAEGMASGRSTAATALRNGDSKKNGAIIGAVIGAAALGGFVGWLCTALKEPGDPSCLPGTLLYTGVGAGIGAAAGAGIDALISANGPPINDRGRSGRINSAERE